MGKLGVGLCKKSSYRVFLKRKSFLKTYDRYGFYCDNRNNKVKGRRCSDYRVLLKILQFSEIPNFALIFPQELFQVRFCCKKEDASQWGKWGKWSECSKVS